jgi:4-carboxymuconolactone decarboxylase
MSDPSPRFTQGMKTRRKVLSDKYVDAAVANTTPFTQDFQTLITESAWGSVWSRETISLRERSMLTIALLAALGQDDEVAMHVRATRNTGASKEDIKEALLHVAIYAGVPAANHAFKIAAKAYAELEAAEKEEKNA